MVYVKADGDFGNTNSFLEKLLETVHHGDLDKYGQWGVDALSTMTPVDTGKTADSWSYQIERQNGKTAIGWYNSNINEGVCIALILQTGHGTRNGAYVEGVDYVNPAMKPIFDQIAAEAWEEVKNA